MPRFWRFLGRTIAGSLGVMMVLGGAGPVALAQDAIEIGYYDNPPLTFVKEGQGPDGLFIALMNEVAQRRGWTLRWRFMNFASGLQDLRDGNLDALIAVARTPEREVDIRFPEEQVVSNWAQIFVDPGAPVSTPLDLQDRRIAVVGGDVYLEGERGLRNLLARLDVSPEFVFASGYRGAAESVTRGEAEAVLMNRFAGAALAEALGLQPTPILFSPIELHVAFSPARADAADLAAAFDEELRQMKGEPDSPYRRALDNMMTGVPATEINSWATFIAIFATLLLIAAVIVALRYREKERRMAEIALTDSLTHAPNRRAFMESARREFNRVKRGEQALSVGVLDIDRFKQVNDSFGHAAGDEVLRDLVLAMQENLRASDLFGRIGGEEFAFLLPCADLHAAMHVAEKLRAAFALREVRAGGRAIRYTVSIGVAEASTEEPRFETALGRADLAVYKAKDNGRNRVEAA